MPATETVEISTIEQAVAWGDSWRSAYAALMLQHERALRELGMQRTFADVFADSWHQLYWER